VTNGIWGGTRFLVVFERNRSVQGVKVGAEAYLLPFSLQYIRRVMP
jgi:hypothetical protein